jgi:hypothetical protein
MLASLGGMVQRDLNGGRVMMDARRAETLFDVVVASMTGMTKIMRRFIPKVARWFDSGHNFYSMCFF